MTSRAQPVDLREVGYPAVCVLCFLRLGRELGVEASSSLQPLTEIDLERGPLTVPWSTAFRFFDELLGQLTAHDKHELARRYLKALPFLKAILPFVASINAFLAILWRGAVGFTIPWSSTYDMRATEHELVIHTQELGAGLGYNEITGLIAQHAPSAIGSPSLDILEWVCTPNELRVVLSAPVDWSSNDRRALATRVPLGTIVQSLQLLGPGATAATRDGLLQFSGQQHAVLELTQLGSDWGITPAEARVALALAESKRPVDVAAELAISVATVRVHLKHLYAKTDTANLRELVERVGAWRRGDI